jgi:two-component system response regulator (stage 0 sporulation protein F)
MNKILVVDDDYAIRLLYAEELGSEGYEIITAGGTVGLLDLIRDEKPDLIILDIILRDGNGLDTLQKIRKDYYDLPVIMCTAYETYKYDLKAFAADYYVVKRSDLSELKLKIRMAMETRWSMPAVSPAVVNG